MKIQYNSSKNPFEGKKPRALTEAEQRKAHRARIRGRKLYG
jgi:GTP-binding protein